MNRLLIILISFVSLSAAMSMAQRRVTPVNNEATATQPRNDFRNDTARINAQRRASLIETIDADGRTILIDTITGKEWVDTTAIKEKKPIFTYPLLHEVTLGLNIWDPAMRLLGQGYGIAEVWGELSLHNRFKPILEIGLGSANYTPEDGNYTYKSKLSPYFRIGMNYNFMFKSSPEYSFYGGVRYGLSPSFNYKVTDIAPNSDYWGETEPYNLPSQTATIGYFEIALGLKVQIYKAFSLGWSVKYHSILHETSNTYGEPWYIPGYGSRNSSLSASFSLMYTIPLKKKVIPIVPDIDTEDDIIDENIEIDTSEHSNDSTSTQQ